MDKETIWIGNDHGGYELKPKIIAHLQELGYDVRCTTTIVRSDATCCQPHLSCEVHAESARLQGWHVLLHRHGAEFQNRRGERDLRGIVQAGQEAS